MGNNVQKWKKKYENRFATLESKVLASCAALNGRLLIQENDLDKIKLCVKEIIKVCDSKKSSLENIPTENHIKSYVSKNLQDIDEKIDFNNTLAMQRYNDYLEFKK